MLHLYSYYVPAYIYINVLETELDVKLMKP